MAYNTFSLDTVSAEETMLQYVDPSFVLMWSVCHRLGFDSPALVIIDNFKGQITKKFNAQLKSYYIETCLLPPNITDITVNKPAKI